MESGESQSGNWRKSGENQANVGRMDPDSDPGVSVQVPGYGLEMSKPAEQATRGTNCGTIWIPYVSTLALSEDLRSACSKRIAIF